MRRSGRCIMEKAFRRFAVLAALILIGLFSALGAVLADGGASAGDASLWPREVDGWKVAEGPTLYDPDKAYTYMDGAAEFFIAFHMQKLTVLRYEKPARPAVTLEIYRMGSPADAYGIFSFEIGEPEAGIGQGSGFGGGLLRFWKGYYFVSVYGDGAGADVETASLEIGRRVAAAIKETGSPPALLALLPQGEAPFPRTRTWYLHSHVLLNQAFFVSHQNIFNLSGDVEAVLGQYGSGKDKLHLLLIKYPDRLQAGKGYAGFRAAYMAGAGNGPVVKKENGRWTASALRGVYVAVVFDAADEAGALKWISAAAAPLQ